MDKVQRDNSKQYASQPLLVVAGCVCVLLAFIGAFLPLMPTTVFVLIAGWCFSRSSEKFDRWLTRQAVLGPIILRWRHHKGIALKDRNRALLLMWASMLLSMLIIQTAGVIGLLLLLGAGVSVYLWRLPIVAPDSGSVTASLSKYQL
ncbi:YbaN family protein [Oceanicoccus sagamiensis]|uniref:Inner membrane protein n=1 Tax=Oceanicoccus sagamiensis TaxID=716816 RepID=A0A1X9NFA2_9GAMM|nr:YbaN family protein [Oceanicoccus sagamiensis]ARN75112.1 hypothetical protein BST96_13905 [Oceanicoccus sagamiensis]